MVVGFVLSFFFFKQKTAYEMRISDWSSDVCSSDLPFDGFWKVQRIVFEGWSGSMRPHTSVAWQPTLSHDGGQSSGASRMTSRLSPSGGIRAIRSAATPAGIGQLWWISPARIGRHSVAPAVFLTSDGAGGSIIPMRDAIVKARRRC